MTDRGEQLFDAYLRGELAEDDRAALIRMLEDDPAAAAHFMDYCMETGLMLQAGEQVEKIRATHAAAEGSPPLHVLPSSRDPARIGWHLRLVAAAAAAVLVCVGIALHFRHTGAAPDGYTVTFIGGEVTMLSRGTAEPAREGATLRSDQVLATGADGRVVLRCRDGSLVRLEPRTRMQVVAAPGAQTFLLSHGRASADVRKQSAGAAFIIETPQARATVVGTRLRLDVDASGTRLDVDEGVVRFQKHGEAQGVEVPAGRRAFAGKDAAIEVDVVPVGTYVDPQDPPDEARPAIPPGHAVVNVENAAQLEAAVAALKSHTTIRLRPGSYRVRNVLVLDNVTDVAIRGATGKFSDVVVLGAAIDRSAEVASLIDVRAASGVLLADLTLGEAKNHAIQLHGESGTGAVRLFHCRLFDCGEALLKTSAGVNAGLVEYSVFERTRLDPVTGGDSGLKVLGGTNWVVRKSLFRNLSSPVKSANAFKFHPAVAFRDKSDGSVVEHCTFFNCDMAIGLGRSGPGDHAGGRISDNIILHERNLFDDTVIGPYGATQRRTADAPVTLWGSAGTEVLRNTILCNSNFPAAVQVRWLAEGTLVRDNRTDAPILVADGAAPRIEENRQDATAALFIRFDPAATRGIGRDDAVRGAPFVMSLETDLRLRDQVQ